MFYSNAYFSYINPNIDLNELEKLIPKQSISPIGKMDVASWGWTPLVRNSECWMLQSSKCGLLKFALETKNLVPSEVNESLNIKINEIEMREGRKVGRKEKADLRENIKLSMLPKAAIKTKYVSVYLDTQSNFLVMDTASAKEIEYIISLLILTTKGSDLKLGITPLKAKSCPNTAMTNWIGNCELPESLEALNQCEMFMSGDGSQNIKYSKIETQSEVVTSQIERGYLFSRLLVRWGEKVSFLMCDDLILRKIKMSDELKSNAKNDSEGGELQDLDTSFAIMNLEFRNLFASYQRHFDIFKPESK